MMKRKHNKRGFTLIELLVVIVILAVLAALIVPNLIRRGDDAKVVAAETDLSTLTALLEQYRLHMGHYPSTEESIYALDENLEDSEDWKGPYTLKGIPVDPWGGEYYYEFYDGDDAYLLMSFGADGVDGGEGLNEDIIGSGE